MIRPGECKVGDLLVFDPMTYVEEGRWERGDYNLATGISRNENDPAWDFRRKLHPELKGRHIIWNPPFYCVPRKATLVLLREMFEEFDLADPNKDVALILAPTRDYGMMPLWCLAKNLVRL